MGGCERMDECGWMDVDVDVAECGWMHVGGWM